MEVKQVRTLNELLSAIEDRKSIFHGGNGSGKRYHYHLQHILQTSLGELIQLVEDGLIYYEHPLQQREEVITEQKITKLR